MNILKNLFLTALATLTLATVAQAQLTEIQVTFDVNFATTGTGFAPLAGVFHDGSFSSFTPGTMASPGLESLAEIGNPSAFLSEVPSTADSGATGGQTGGSNRPTSRSFSVFVDPSNTNFSFAAMFLPSNDWFAANQGGGSLDISSLIGASAGTALSLEVDTIYDAGTELEDFTRGGGTGTDPFNLAPRLSDANGGNPDDQMDNVALVPRVAGQNLFAGFTNPNNEPIDRFLAASSAASLATITLTVVPEPDAGAMMLVSMLGLLGMMRRRRRK